jgi:hypothetical protein
LLYIVRLCLDLSNKTQQSKCLPKWLYHFEFILVRICIVGLRISVIVTGIKQYCIAVFIWNFLIRNDKEQLSDVYFPSVYTLWRGVQRFCPFKQNGLLFFSCCIFKVLCVLWTPALYLIHKTREPKGWNSQG